MKEGYALTFNSHSGVIVFESVVDNSYFEFSYSEKSLRDESTQSPKYLVLTPTVTPEEREKARNRYIKK